ncbi:TonB-dependent receptor [Idiomarina tyrosinivorans]|uniref:TonB-dependent receptor n=1 Tax=Idiomarina tyrosinivorans TaxID=1445662 RepID=A0A432ZQX1_9GAMM|nr:TonB-dependent receptor [Idiomarina tyrosinivorans]RUO80231.1 TonB-dependent receptor [Idiomarina tyrosinivorans]
MRNKFFKRTLTAAAVAAAMGCAVPALAQNSGGFLLGQSVNRQGEVISSVEITITNLETGLTRTVTSGEDGRYRFPLLPPGQYSLKATKPGFGTLKEELLNVRVGGRTNIDLTMVAENAMETIEVSGSAISMIDTTSAESEMVIGQDFLSKIPVPRDLSSVALLAPGTTRGDSAFGNLASFGGASVGENVYYVNGLNVTNFRNGLGGTELPFEMYETFEVKTGGYSAEYGRSTGGVINATTKSGTNDFHWGASAYFEPASLRSNAPDYVLTDQDAIDENGSKYWLTNGNDEVGENNYNIWASGALIEDKLFFFGLLNYKDRISDFSTATVDYDRDAADVLYAAKIDWYVTANHILEFTGWDNSSSLDAAKYDFDYGTDKRGRELGQYVLERGGQSYALKYTGILTDDLTLSALYGVNKASYSNLNTSEPQPPVVEYYSGIQFTQYGLTSPSIQNDKRTAYRVDIDWYVHPDHTIRAGIDYEDLEAYEDTSRIGDSNTLYQYYGCDPAAVAALDLENANCSNVLFNTYVNKGSFETKSNAFYVQDTWYITPDLVARLGLRNETFENYNKAGDKFVDVSDQWAPRLGLSWDVNGDGTSKAFLNYGRYYLPVATNTNIRLAGDELYTVTGYAVQGLNDDLTPIVDESAPLTTTVYSDGTLKGTDETVNANLDPMYQDEYIMGYETLLTEGWTAGIKATYRDLKSSLEDVAIDAGFNRYLEDEFNASCTNCDGFHYYVLTNPGNDVTITTDPDGASGPLEDQAYTIPGSYLGYPDSVRKYMAVDLTLTRAFADDWMLDASYTWSHSWGNNEGFVRSDNGQTDAGLTTNFDQPGLLDGAYGNLPNDRRHMVKVRGSYSLTDNFSLGANFTWESGRPKNAFGFHPTDAFASLYEAESFYRDGELVPRGSLGRTPSNWRLDMSARYATQINGADVVFRADVFNVFNNDEYTEINEISEVYGGGRADGGYAGIASNLYGLPTSYQTPRYVRLSAEVKF